MYNPYVLSRSYQHLTFVALKGHIESHVFCIQYYNTSILIVGPDLETVHKHAERIPFNIPISCQKQTSYPSPLGYWNCLWLVKASQPYTIQQLHMTFHCD